MIPSMRESLFYDLGVKIPAVRLRTDSRVVGPTQFQISIDEVPVDRGEYPVGEVLANESPRGLELFELEAAPAEHPVTRDEAAWVAAEEAEMLEEAGYSTWDGAGYLVLRMTAALKENAAEFVTIQNVQGMLDQLEGPYPALVEEVVPKLVGRPTLAKVLRRLADEGISLRNLPRILEVLSDRAKEVKDPIELTEEVRAGLSRHITDTYAGPDGSVVVYVVGREVEDTLEGAVRSGEDGEYLALSPEVSREILEAVDNEISRDLESGRRPVLLTNQTVRRHLRKLVSLEVDRCAVLAYQELEPAAQVQPLGKIVV
jgi:type III secretion protein V